jgi:hypothetical protein
MDGQNSALVCIFAAASGNVQAVSDILLNQDDSELVADTATTAARHGQLAVLQWLWTIDSFKDILSRTTKDLLKIAGRNYDFDIVTWILQCVDHDVATVLEDTLKHGYGKDRTTYKDEPITPRLFLQMVELLIVVGKADPATMWTALLPQWEKERSTLEIGERDMLQDVIKTLLVHDRPPMRVEEALRATRYAYLLATDSFPFATLGNGLDIRRTSLPNTGPENRGLFATRVFHIHELVTEYTGELISRNEAFERRRTNRASHIRSIDRYQLIDGDQDPVPGQGIAQFTNDGTDGNNTKFTSRYDHHQGRTRVFLQATHLIQADEGVFVNYGKDYWVQQRPIYDGILTLSDVVNIKVQMSRLYSKYQQTYLEEPEDKSDHYEIDVIVDGNFDRKKRLRFRVQWANATITTVTAEDICHNLILLQDFYQLVDPLQGAVVPVQSTLPTIGSKVCTKCAQRKSTSTEFRKRYDGYRGQCKACEREVEEARQ